MIPKLRRSSKGGTNGSRYLFLKLIQHIQEVIRSNSLGMAMSFHAWTNYWNQAQPQERKFAENFYFLKTVSPIQTMQDNRSILKIILDQGKALIHFYINSTRIIEIIKLHRMSVPSININKSLPTLVQSVSCVRVNFKRELTLLP